MGRLAPLSLLAAPLLIGPARAEFSIAPAQAQKMMTSRATVVRAALGRRDFATLARFVHPGKGLRFPNGCSKRGAPGPGPKFTAAQVARLWSDKTIYNWGPDGQRDEPTKATFKRRYAFIWNPRYKEPTETNFNRHRADRPLNYVHGLDRAFPGAVCVEFYVRGDKKHEGRNWSSLWLVFEPYREEWRLTAILNDYQGI